MEISGKIIAVLEPKSGVSQRNGNEWKSQEFVIETHDQYPKKCVFRVFGADKLTQFDIKVGEEMTVSFDIDAHEWQGRWFNDINAWKVDRTPLGEPQAAPAPAATSVAPIDAAPADGPAPAPFPAGESVDDLPF